jgi:hypothetical protein
MAKLKFNEVELKADLPKNSLQEDADKAVEDLIKKIKPSITSSLKQSVHSLGHNVTKLSQKVDSKESQLLKRLSDIESRVQTVGGVSEEVIKKLSDELKLKDKKHEEQIAKLLQKTQKLEANLTSKLKEKPLKPKVEQITVHKNHDKDITALKQEIKGLYKSNVKIVKVEKLKYQKYLNLALGVGLALSLLMHIL